MIRRTLVVAPHPDDEILGCGGTLLRRQSEGCTVGWLLMTSILEEYGWTPAQIERRKLEIEFVRKGLGISPENLFELGFPTAELDQTPMSVLVNRISAVFRSFKPDEVLLPYPGDVHSDHRVTFEAATACSKWFRYPSIKRILAYETLSETDFGIDPCSLGAFRPNVFIDTGDFFAQKLELLTVYASEIGNFPFPRSEDAVRAQAKVRGAQAGFEAAEGFMLLLERSCL